MSEESNAIRILLHLIREHKLDEYSEHNYAEHYSLYFGHSVTDSNIDDENFLTHCSHFPNLHLCITRTKWSFSFKSSWQVCWYSRFYRNESIRTLPELFQPPENTTLHVGPFLQLVEAAQTRSQDLRPHATTEWPAIPGVSFGCRRPSHTICFFLPIRSHYFLVVAAA